MDEMKSVAGDGLEDTCSVKHKQRFKGINGKVQEHLQDYQQDVQRRLSASRKEVEILRRVSC